MLATALLVTTLAIAGPAEAGPLENTGLVDECGVGNDGSACQWMQRNPGCIAAVWFENTYWPTHTVCLY